jgi:hypothetical protein
MRPSSPAFLPPHSYPTVGAAFAQRPHFRRCASVCAIIRHLMGQLAHWTPWLRKIWSGT